jgi:hypothetical protein
METTAEPKMKEICVGNKRLLAVSLDGKTWIWPPDVAEKIERESEARRQAMGQTARRLFGRIWKRQDDRGRGPRP